MSLACSFDAASYQVPVSSYPVMFPLSVNKSKSWIIQPSIGCFRVEEWYPLSMSSISFRVQGRLFITRHELTSSHSFELLVVNKFEQFDELLISSNVRYCAKIL